jgi:stage III sporulation protein AE
LLTFFFGFLALILGYQSTIAAGADTLGARTVKFTVGSTVPLVGGALAESVRTLAGSIAVLRATVGTVGILCVVAILLQPLLLLWAHQLFFGVLGAVGGLLNCPKQGEFFVRMQELLKFAWSLMLACGLFFLFLFSVFARSAVAYGG